MAQFLQAIGAIFLVLFGGIILLLVGAWIHESWTAIMNYPKAKQLKTVVDEQRVELDRRSHRIFQLEAELADLKHAASGERGVT